MAVPSLAQLLATFSKGNPTRYGEETPRINAIEQAPILADAITRYQKETRAKPFVDTLAQLSSQWAKAKTDAEKNDLHERANEVRRDYLVTGGSPIDMPTSAWGSSPDQGFEIEAGNFKPSYMGDNLSFGQKANLSALTGMFEGEPTWGAQVQTQTLQNAQDQIEASMNNAQMDYDSSMANLAEQSRYHNMLDGYQQYEQTRNSATDKWMAEMSNAPSLEIALNRLNDPNEYGKMLAEGANISQIYQDVLKRFTNTDPTGNPILSQPKK